MITALILIFPFTSHLLLTPLALEPWYPVLPFCVLTNIGTYLTYWKLFLAYFLCKVCRLGFLLALGFFNVFLLQSQCHLTTNHRPKPPKQELLSFCTPSWDHFLGIFGIIKLIWKLSFIFRFWPFSPNSSHAWRFQPDINTDIVLQG